MDKIKVITCNVRGLADKVKRRQVFQYFRRHKYDIIFMQETHSTANTKRFWKSEWGGKTLFSHGTSNAKGVAILFARDLDVEILQCYNDYQGRSIVALVKVNEQKIALCNTYAPNEDQVEFFTDLSEKLLIKQADHVIWGGDFNLNLLEEDKQGGSKFVSSKSAQYLNNFMEESAWVDVWRYFHPDQFQFTWKKTKPAPVFSRLDYFIIPEGSLDYVSKCEIMPGFKSDHSFVKIELSFAQSMRGPGTWKLNTTYLANKTYVDGVNILIDRAKDKFGQNVTKMWEYLKFDIGEFSREFAVEKARSRKNQIKQLEKQIHTCEKKLNFINLRADNAIKLIQKINLKLDTLHVELDKHTRYEVEGIMLRTKARWVEHGEKNTKFFLGLEKFRAKSKSMKCVQTQNGKLEYDQNNILQEQANYFQQLYQKDPAIKFRLQDIPGRKLDVTQKILLESELTLEEISDAIKEMPRNKTGGPDGLPVDFYKVFWIKIKEILLQVYHKCKDNKLMFSSARQGTISLIPKKGKNRLLLKNWRPIMLLNVDYKILSKAMANRLKIVLPDIIDPDQTGFTKGKDITENLRKMLDVMEIALTRKLPAIIVFVDFEKAFDRVDLQALIELMKCLNFGDQMIEWVELLFTKFNLATTNYGHMSEFLHPTRGLLQGNPIAPYLFLLIGEVLARILKKNKQIEGIDLAKGGSIMLSQFADDLALFLKFKAEVWQGVMDSFDTFEAHTGMKISYDKTIIYRIGSIRDSDAKFYSTRKINWSNEPVNTLGIWVSHDPEQSWHLNFDPIIKKMDSTLSLWKKRGVTLLGKIQVLNSLIGSLWVYKCAVLPVLPKKLLAEIKIKFLDFIWDGKKSKIAWSTLIGLKENGGLGLVDLANRDQALKAQWVIKIQTKLILKKLAQEIIQLDYDWLWEAQLVKEDVNTLFVSVSAFWKSVLTAWFDTNFQDPIDGNQVKEQIIWLNSNIRIGGKPVVITELEEKGIHRIKHLLNCENHLLSWEEARIKFDLKNFLVYQSTVAAILTSWKKLLHEENGLEYRNPVQEGLKSVKLVNSIYRFRKQDKLLLRSYVIKWNNTMNTDINEEDFLTFVSNIKQMTIVTKLRSFQYRLMLHAMITNRKLMLYKIRENDHCTFCQNQVETVMHLFTKCSKVIPVWAYIERLCKTKLDKSQIIFNNVVNNPKHVENTIVLLTKFVIYKFRCMEKIPSIENVKIELKNLQEIEGEIARKKDKEGHHGVKLFSKTKRKIFR